jgi:hypothetical protein
MFPRLGRLVLALIARRVTHLQHNLAPLIAYKAHADLEEQNAAPNRSIHLFQITEQGRSK